MERFDSRGGERATGDNDEQAKRETFAVGPQISPLHLLWACWATNESCLRLGTQALHSEVVGAASERRGIGGRDAG